MFLTIQGIISRVSAAISTFLLRAPFTSKFSRTLVNGQILNSTDDGIGGVEAGSLTVVDTSTGLVDIVDNQLSLTGANSTNTSGVVMSSGINRTRGKAMVFKVSYHASANSVNGMNNSASLNWNGSPIGVYAVTDIKALDGVSDPIVSTVNPRGKTFEFAIVLGSYSSGIPWNGVDGGYSDGYSLFVKHTTDYPNWTLLWKESSTSDSIVYPFLNTYPSGGSDTFDYLKVPTTDFSSLLAPVVLDTFTDADSTSLDLHTMDIGTGWTEALGEFIITTNKVRVSPTTIGIAVTDTSKADVLIVADVDIGGDGAIRKTGLIARYLDNNNYWEITYLPSSDTFAIKEVNTGTPTTRASTTIVGLSNVTAQFTIICDGQTITAFIDGANKISYSSATLNETNTKHGIYLHDYGDYIDNFAVYPRGTGNEYSSLDNQSSSYDLHASFDIPDRVLNDGDILTPNSNTLVRDGSLTVVDTSTGSVSVASNELSIVATGSVSATGVKTETGLISSGKGILFTDLGTAANLKYVGVNNTFGGNPYGLYRQNATCTIRPDTLNAHTISNAGKCKHAIVYGGYDANGAPINNSDNISSYDYGRTYFIKEDTWPDWRLYWKDPRYKISSSWLAYISAFSNGVDHRVSDFRIPNANLSNLLEPVILDTFTIDYGAELVTNGTFDTDTDWVKGTGWTISGGTASSDGTQTAASYLEQTALVPEVYREYEVNFTVTGYVAGNIMPFIGGAGLPSSISADGDYVKYITTANTDPLKIRASADFVGSVDNVSVRKVNSERELEKHDPDIDTVGGGWLIDLIGMEIESDRAKADGNSCSMVIDSGESDHICECIVNNGDETSRSTRLIVRYQDTDNNWFGYQHGVGNLNIYERVAAVNTSRASTTTTISTNTDYRHMVICNDEEITMFFDNASRISYALATNFKTETKVGIFAERAATQRIDNFTVYPIGNKREFYELDVAGNTYDLHAPFITADKTLVDGEVLDGTEQVVENGSLTAVDTGTGTVSITNNQCVIASDTNWITTGIHGDGITRAIGVALLAQWTRTGTDRVIVGFSDVNGVQDNPDTGIKVVDSLYRALDDHSLLGAIDPSDQGLIDFAIVLGGYDINGVPYKVGDNKANFTYGASYFVKDSNNTNWTLTYRVENSDGITLYPEIITRDTIEVNKLEVPKTNFASLLSPIVMDTFTDTDTTALASHTPDVDTVGAGWSVPDGTITIIGNETQASTVNFVKAIGVIDTGKADIVGEIYTKRSVGVNSGQVGFVLRYVDNNNYWYASQSDNLSIRIHEYTATVLTERASNNTGSYADDTYHRLICITDDETITIQTGSIRASYASATAHKTSTKHGIFDNMNNTWIDNIAFYARGTGNEYSSFDTPSTTGYELKANFLGDNRTLADGDVWNADGIWDGQLTIIDTTTGIVEILSNELKFTTAGTNSVGIKNTEGISESLGKAFLLKYNTGSTINDYFGFYDTVNPSFGSKQNIQFVSGDIRIPCNVSTGVRGTVSNNTEYQIAIVLGGYDINGVPYKNGDTKANFDYGYSVLIKGGIYSQWSLLWKESTQYYGTVYPYWMSATTGSNPTINSFKVPSEDLSRLLEPIALDTFTDTNGTSLDAHTMDIGSGWTNGGQDAANWNIQSNRADYASANWDHAYIETLVSDVFIETDCRFNGVGPVGVSSGAGIVLRRSSDTAYWMLTVRDDDLTLFENNSGYTSRASAVITATVVDTDYKATAIAEGQTITCFMNGGNKISYALATLNETVTTHGVVGKSGDVGVDSVGVDNFAVYPRGINNEYSELETY